MRRHSGFKRGQGVFTCVSCLRRTRGSDDTIGSECCSQCEELAGWDNQFNDDGTKPNPSELRNCNQLLQIIADRGGDVDKVKSESEYIWEEEYTNTPTVDRPCLYVRISEDPEALERANLGLHVSPWPVRFGPDQLASYVAFSLTYPGA